MCASAPFRFLVGSMVAALAVIFAAAPAAGQSSGPLVQWGDTNFGQALNAPSTVGPYMAIAAGKGHNLALRVDGSLVQWGNTTLNQAANAPSTAGPYIAITAGQYHSLALRADGSLVQWGDTAFGQAVDAPPAAGPYIAIAAGSYHNLALRADGSLVRWGSTNPGSAPAASERFVAISAGNDHSLALRPDGSLVQWGDTSSHQADNAPPAAGPYIAIAAGQYHNLALRADGSLVQWGNTSADQAANAPSAAGPYIAIAAGQFHNLALRADGSLVQWGSQSRRQTSNAPPAAGPYVAIAAGFDHNLALLGVPSARVSFTYQGRLSGQSGPTDLRFSLFTAATGGSQLGATTAVSALTPDPQGVFTAQVQPGLIDASRPLWLEISARPAGTGAFTTLAPRQPITSSPRASFAERAAVAATSAHAAIADTATTAAQLNGQAAGFYTNASNLNAGTIPQAVLPASGWSTPQLNSNSIGSGATFTTINGTTANIAMRQGVAVLSWSTTAYSSAPTTGFILRVRAVTGGVPTLGPVSTFYFNSASVHTTICGNAVISIPSTGTTTFSLEVARASGTGAYQTDLNDSFTASIINLGQ